MEPNNLDLTRQNNTTQFPVNSSAAGIGVDLNGQDIFSTLRNLAATGNASNYTNTAQQMVLPTPNPWPYNPPNNWLEQAKLSLLPMYGLLQQTTSNPNTIPQQNNCISFLDQSIQNVAAETARKVASLNQQPLFGQLSSLESHQQYGPPTMDLPITSGINQHSSLLRSYSQSIPSTSQTAQMVDQISSQKCPTVKSDYIQRELNADHQSIEDFTDFDLQDFEDLLMEKPSNSFENPHSNESEYSQKVQSRPETIDQSFPSRIDELENADKELDRLVSSLVANQSSTMPLIPINAHQSKTNDRDLIQNSSTNTNKFTILPLALVATSNSSEDVSLNMPKFTPPDSPTNVDTLHTDGAKLIVNDNVIKNDSFQKERQSSSKINQIRENRQNSLSMIPKEQIKMEPFGGIGRIFGKGKFDGKLPIYKQKLAGLMLDRNNANQDQSKVEKMTSKIDPADEYCFDDEFDEKPLLGTSNAESHRAISSSEKNVENQESIKTKRKYTRRIGSATNIETVEQSEKGPATSQSDSTPKLAEQIRRRNQTWSFLKSEIAKDDNSAISEFPIATCTLKNAEIASSSNNIMDSSQTLPLPKLIIRIPRRESKEEFTAIDETNEITNKKKKRKKKKYKDLDWTETAECKFIKHKKHKDKKHKKERKKRKHSIESCDEFECRRKEVDIIPEIMEDLSKNEINKEEEIVDPTRLHYFEHPTERPKRGTFLILKDDLFKSDCSLWRIDNQNLLQKYLPITLEDGTLCYENSQTYSGWCENYVHDYMAIKVEYVKQSRSENIVRPLLPLQELFPAINLLITEEQNVTKDLMDRKNKNEYAIKDKQIRNQINNIINIMLEHSITLQFIQTIKQSNDWNYLRTLTEIELQVKNRLENIRKEHPLWSEPFVNSLKNFPTIFFSNDFNAESEEKQSCQACLIKSFDVHQAIQLFAEEIYEPETLVPKRVTDYDSSICTIDFYICNRCVEAAAKYHKIYHLLYRILKYCEAKVETVSAENDPAFNPSQIIAICSEDKEWVDKIYEEVIDVLY